MVWSFMQNARMYEALRDYGDRLDTVGIFTFEVDATGTLSETGTSISSMMTYINKWPHIHWMLTCLLYTSRPWRKSTRPLRCLARK